MGVLRRLFSGRWLNERRAARRRTASLPVRFRIQAGNRTSPYGNGLTRDLSLTGLAIETQAVRLGDLDVYNAPDMVSPARIEIEIVVSKGIVKLTAEVARYDLIEPSRYFVGLRIVDISDTDRRAYEELVRAFDK